MILAGFDCREASVKTYGYNVSVIVRKKRAELPALWCDCGDLELLAEFFSVAMRQGVDGRLGCVNW